MCAVSNVKNVTEHHLSQRPVTNNAISCRENVWQYQLPINYLHSPTHC